MKPARLVVPAVAAISIAGCLVIGSLSAVATAQPATPTASTASAPAHALLKRRPASIPAGRWAASSPMVAELRNRQAHPARPAIAHLAPQLNRLAGVAGSPAANSGVRLERDGTVTVTVTGPAALAAAKAVGARVLASFDGSSTVVLAPAKLRSLAGQPGVSTVAPAVRPMPQGISEGVADSGAQNWAQTGDVGNGGAGVKVGIVDMGFKDLQAEIAAGNFNDPEGNPVSVVYPAGQNHCFDDTTTAHGTAVSEIVHQMAPRATVYLYCIDDYVGFSTAASQVVSSGVKIVNSSLAFAGESRGDGFGAAGSPTRAVKAAREAGVLWIQASGNSAQDHWSGRFADSDTDGLLDLESVGSQADEVPLDAGDTGYIVLSWDKWPTSSLGVSLAVAEFEMDDNQHSHQIGNTAIYDQTPGAPPVLAADISNVATDPGYTGGVRYFDLVVLLADGTPAVRYDLSYGGDVYPSYLSGRNPARAATGSVLEPASSPWVLAVGAAYQGSGHALETFSSRGPTIDGRTKPDLLGYDGVTSNISEVQSSQFDDQGNVIAGTTGFYGTSAAAPHVAGAAALVAAANPAMDASDLEAFLQRRADPLGTPPTNTAGYGLLSLGAPSDIQPAAGSRYFRLSAPRRIADTRSGLGVRKGLLGAGAVLAVPVPTTGANLVPADATSAVISLSGAGAQGSTYLAVYSKAVSGNSTLNLSQKVPDDTVIAVVKLNSSHGFMLRNSGAAVHAVINVLGYFGAPTAAGGLGYLALPSRRLLDTRIPTGIAKKAKLAPNQTVTVATGVPTTATAAVVSMTALNRTGAGYLTAYPSASPALVSLDYRHLPKSSLVVVPLTQGRFVLQNRSASTDLMIDIVGYFSPTATARFVTLANPRRIADTRTGTGGRYGTMGPNAVLTLDAGGLYGVPYTATGLWLGMTALASGDGYLTIYPKGTSAPHAVDLNFTVGQTVPNAGIATLSARTATAPPAFSTVDRFGASNVISDAYGYFVSPGA